MQSKTPAGTSVARNLDINSQERVTAIPYSIFFTIPPVLLVTKIPMGKDLLDDVEDYSENTGPVPTY